MSEERPPYVVSGSTLSLAAHIHAIEEAYEFMLAYAAQGLPGAAGAPAGGELRGVMTRAVDALEALDAAIAAAAGDSRELAAFRELVAEDARRALIKIRLVLAQPFISSQVVDNLNASIHLRALLTDLFLLDEVLKPSI